MLLSRLVGLFTLALAVLAGCGAQSSGSVPPKPVENPAVAKAPDAPKTAPSAAEAKVEAVGLVLVLDRSGSMTGEKFEQAKKACISAIGALKKDDRVAVVLFDSEANVLVELGDATRPELADTVRAMQPGGGTDIKPGLETAARLIPDGDIRFRIVLMSDGMAPHAGLEEVVGELRHRGITLSSVALGEEADRDLLKKLAESGGGTFHDVALPTELETVFVQEASDRTRRKAP